MLLFFLSSGLFLGWSLGANDAANVFGTAVGSRMIKFKTAAIICGVFVILGAVIGGSGTSETLGKLGSVNELGGAFTVALSAAVAIFVMVRIKLPVSTSQAIVGAIIGWNFFAHRSTDITILTQIVGTWVICPILAGVIAAFLYIIVRFVVNRSSLHLLRQDQFTRYGLIIVGAFGAYSLGANNIANVVGVFVPSSPLHSFAFPLIGTFSGTQQLFLLGGISIAVGVATYSKGVMETVGSNVVKLTPLAALIVVMAEATVLFVFASKGLNAFLTAHGLPPVPLVPISSSQAAIGALVGIGLVRGGKGIHYSLLGKISLGWIATPILASIITFFALFFMQNVFNQTVIAPDKATVEIQLQKKEPLIETSAKTDLHSKKKLNSYIRQHPGCTAFEKSSSQVRHILTNSIDHLMDIKGFDKKTIRSGFLYLL
ncbi:MAG: inorganic phosphate transporter [Acidobacteria bacterium]|nr:MAG: inorganic phosphate transporter [Acidobacteriota bacterium]RLE23916.1 MAG: inorganic phosphate transporter [Acidobacteriota bacterium]